MILLLSIQTVHDSEIIPLYERLPVEIKSNIDRIYCIGNPEIVKEAKPNKVIMKIPVSYFSNDKKALELLTQNLYFNRLIVHARNFNRYIYYLIRNHRDFEIYIGKTRSALPKYIDDKELFLAVSDELSKINFNHNQCHSVNEAYLNLTKQIQNLYPQKQIEDAILSKEQFLIIQFDTHLNNAKKFNTITLLDKIPLSKILMNIKQFCKQDLLIDKKIIELWIGIEHLSDNELNALIFMMRNIGNNRIFYRLIVHGPIPQNLREMNLNVISFQTKHFFPLSSSSNISKLFYSKLIKALLIVSGKSKIYDYQKLLEQDAFKPLIHFSKSGHLKNAILNAMPTKEEVLEKPFQLNDNYFWYQLTNYFITIARSKKTLKAF